MIWYAPLLISLYRTSNYWRSFWWDRWAFTALLASLLITRELWRRVHASVGVLFIILFASSLSVYGWYPSYAHLGLETKAAISQTTAYSGIALMLTAMAFLHLRHPDYLKLGDTIAGLCALNSLVTLAQMFVGATDLTRGGLFGNPSMSGCFTAMTYPYLVMQERERLDHPSLVATVKRALYILLPPLSIAVGYASQPVGVLVVVIAAYTFAKEENLRAAIFTVVGAVIAAFVLLVIFAGNPDSLPFGTTGRAYIWDLGLSWWREQGHWLLGTGRGTTEILLRLEQSTREHRQTGDWWLWLHSDWLELLVENGVIGLTAGIWFWWTAMRKAFGTPWLFAAAAGFTATALFNFPTHMPLHALVGVTTFGYIFERTWNAQKKRTVFSITK